MIWSLFFKKVAQTALTGAVASVGTQFASGVPIDGLDPKSAGLVTLISGFVGGLLNWYKHGRK